MGQQWNEEGDSKMTLEAEPRLGTPLEIQRILVALDASPGSLAALATAARLASLLGARLLGVFVEDVNLVRVARLPFAREVRYLSATVEPLTEQKVAQRLQLQAIRAQLAFVEAAERNKVRGSFHVVQGLVTAELLAAALQADLLVMGRVGRAAVTRMGSTARAALQQASCSVLLMQPGVDVTQPVLVVYDGSEGGRRALTLAAHLAQPGRRLHVLSWAPDEEMARHRNKEATAHLQGYDLEVSTQQVVQYETESIVHIIHHANPGIVVLGETGCRLPSGILRTLLEELHRPLLIVRGRTQEDSD